MAEIDGDGQQRRWHGACVEHDVLMPRLRWTIPVPFTTLLVLGCDGPVDEERFRVYTTQASAGDGGSCPDVVATDVDPRRSLIETNVTALAPLTLDAVGSAVGTSAGLWDDDLHGWRLLGSILARFSPVSCPGYVSPAPMPRLGVEVVGLPGINDYPILCERYEQEAIYGWTTIAAVNRFDLAPADGSNCGEARLISSTQVGNFGPHQMTVIFEAQLPNPSPECGIEACRPVQEFWAGLSEIDDPAARADELRLAFLDGHPDLEAAGFGPFMSLQNLTFGTGQIRVNAFSAPPRTLREFKAVLTVSPWGESQLSTVPVPVAGNPYGGLWHEHALPHAAACQDALVDSVQHLMVGDPNLMAVDLPEACLAAESPGTTMQDYAFRLALDGGPFKWGSLSHRIQEEILALDPASTLSAEHIARRAEQVSCIGCHGGVSPSDDLGNGVSGVLTPGQHVIQSPTEPCPGGSCYPISVALEDTFLPFREQVMEAFLDATACCTDEGGACCEVAPPEPPACNPMLQLCDPVVLECDPTSESCDVQLEPLPECDPTSESCGTRHDPTEECSGPEAELGLCSTQEMALGRPQGFAAAAAADGPRPLETLDVEAFIALERQLRLRQSPTTISGRPNVGGH